VSRFIGLLFRMNLRNVFCYNIQKYIIFFLFICMKHGYTEDLTFILKSDRVTSFSYKQINSGELRSKFGTIKSNEIKLFNVFRGYEKIYTGYDFFELLNIVFGESWKTSQRIIFISKDGYQQFSTIYKMINSAEGKRGFLAFKEKDKKGFSTFFKNGKEVDPGTYYLVWSNFSEMDKANHADNLKWPYRIKSIEIK
jgi:hypothetical protein